MRLWEGSYYSTQEAAVGLHLAGFPAAPMPSWTMGTVWDCCPLSPWECRHSSAAPVLAPAQSQGPAVLLGLSLRGRGYEHINHSSKKEKFQAIEQGEKQSICISLPLVSELFTQKLSIAFPGFPSALLDVKSC